MKALSSLRDIEQRFLEIELWAIFTKGKFIRAIAKAVCTNTDYNQIEFLFYKVREKQPVEREEVWYYANKRGLSRKEIKDMFELPLSTNKEKHFIKKSILSEKEIAQVTEFLNNFKIVVDTFNALKFKNAFKNWK